MLAAGTLLRIFVVAAGLCRIAGAEVAVYTSRAAFLAAITAPATIDFGKVGGASDSGVLSITSVAFTVGLTFFVPGLATLSVIGPKYCCATYNRGFVSISAGQAPLNIAFGTPLTAKAIGFDAFTVAAGNLAGTNQDVIDVTVEGISYHFTSPVAPSVAFIGFISTSPFSSNVVVSTSPNSRQVDIQNALLASVANPGPSPAPFGSVDTPAKNTTNVSGAIGVTGWALSSNSLSSVAVWREPVFGEPANLVFVGNSSMIPSARPDVAAAYPSYPNNSFGWGLQLLTNQLPSGGGQPPGNGTYKLHVIATNPEGGSTDLAGPISITVTNASATVPFGTIDTPTQGGIVSGSAYVNFGWALTPVPANIIPKDGSTITVVIDNKPVGHPVYNNNRSDIATLFPGLQNSNGAIGFYTIDTTKLTNGIHSISWVVSDNLGHAQGIGSRYFFVQN